jgi:hypothetical protein
MDASVIVSAFEALARDEVQSLSAGVPLAFAFAGWLLHKQ